MGVALWLRKPPNPRVDAYGEPAANMPMETPSPGLSLMMLRELVPKLIHDHFSQNIGTPENLEETPRI